PGELRVIERVEELEAQLQVARAFAAQRKVLVDRDVVIVDAGIAQVRARVRPNTAKGRNDEGVRVDQQTVRPFSRIALDGEARLLSRKSSAGVSARDALSRVNAGDGQAQLQRRSRNELRDAGDLPVIEDASRKPAVP